MSVGIAPFPLVAQIDLLDDSRASLLAIGVSLVLSLAAYMYVAICLMTIAAKTNTPGGWMAWFPVLNLFLATSAARMSAMWAFAAMIPCFQVIAAPMIVSGLAAARGKSGALALLLFVPGLNLLLPLLLAMGPAAASTVAQTPLGGTVVQVQQGVNLPQRSGSSGVLLGFVGMACLAALVCCGGGGFFFYNKSSGYASPTRQAVKTPPGIAGTRIAFPRDSDPTSPFQPTTTMSQTVRHPAGGPPKLPMEIPPGQLPPGIDGQTLAIEATSISSGTYRPPCVPPPGETTNSGTATNSGAAGPTGVGPSPSTAVTIHCLTPSSAQTGQNLVGKITQANPGAQVRTDGIQTPAGQQFARWTIVFGQRQTIVMQSYQSPLVVVIYTPTPEAAPIAERLSQNVGNSQGLDNTEVVTCIETLPAAPPSGFEMESLWSWSKAETDPATFNQGFENNPEIAQLMQQLYAIAPDWLTVASYTDGVQEYDVAVCAYSSAIKASLLWNSFSWTLGTQATARDMFSQTEGLVFQDQSGTVAVFQKGPYLVILHAAAGADIGQLRALADTLQL